ncbi:hypothetical protein WISP_150448 [Willisornis vidua]|uniref:Uncharacterized protein n=1 Tax=Willisornis vidua TaxID=1566151 RepID=A0ABQ9CKS0_9PASS|nr:hypothetical protein WISP_150448 [Willisornis vidua]
MHGAAFQNRSILLYLSSFHDCAERGNSTVDRFRDSRTTGERWGTLVEDKAQRGCDITEPCFDMLCHTSSGQYCGSGKMLKAQVVMVFTCCLFLLFLVAVQAQDVQTTPIQGQGADVTREKAFPGSQMNSMLIPSWYPKAETGNDFQKALEVPKEVPKDSEKAISGQAAGEKAKTIRLREPDIFYILGIGVVVCVLLLWTVACCICMSWLRSEDM